MLSVNSRFKRKHPAVWGVVLALGLGSGPARAVDVQTYVAPGNSLYMLNESANLSSRGRLFLGIDYDILNDPLVELSADHSQRITTLMDSFMTLDLTAGYKVAQRLSLDVTLPFNLAHPLEEGRTFALGDIRLFAKVPLLSFNSRWQLSLIPELKLPTGDPDLFLSNSSLSYGLLVALEYDFRYFSTVANIGYRYAPNAIYEDLDYKQKIPLSLGVNVPLIPRLSANVEAQGARVFPFNSSQNPAEIYGGLRFMATNAVVLHGGMSVSTFSTVPSADYRVLFGLKIEPLPREDTGPMPQASSASELVSADSMERSDTISSGYAQRKVVLTPENIDINQEVRFEHDSATLTPDSEKLLNQVASLITANIEQIKQVGVEGHTNELGSDAYNLKLSQRRAESVMKYLVSRSVPEGKLYAVGYGKRRPRPGSMDLPREERLRVNRRVEFKTVLEGPRLGQR
jgi:outer membrane protein OmpA-like peptidoglycan-associated protein